MACFCCSLDLRSQGMEYEDVFKSSKQWICQTWWVEVKITIHEVPSVHLDDHVTGVIWLVSSFQWNQTHQLLVRYRLAPVCVCVCVWERERDWEPVINSTNPIDSHWPPPQWAWLSSPEWAELHDHLSQLQNTHTYIHTYIHTYTYIIRTHTHTHTHTRTHRYDSYRCNPFWTNYIRSRPHFHGNRNQ